MIRWVLSLFGVAMLAAWSSFAEPLVIEREISLKLEARTHSQAICLSDLVNDSWIQGRCAVDRGSCCRWSLGGQREKKLSRRDIEQELTKVNWGGFTIVVKGGDEVAVFQVGRELRTEEIQAKVASAVAARFAQDKRDVGISNLKVPQPIVVDFTAESDWDVVLLEPFVENASIKIISTLTPGKVIGWVQAGISLQGEVFVAKRTVHPSEQIQADDFELRKTNILPVQQLGITMFKSDQFPIGTRARQTVLAGAALTSASVEKIPMVKFGDAVTLILRSDNLRISAKGVAQGSAAIGDMVTVQLQRYNRTFRGRLVDGRLVEVWL